MLIQMPKAKQHRTVPTRCELNYTRLGWRETAPELIQHCPMEMKAR